MRNASNRAQRELPAGYQFGDASTWRPAHENAAERLERQPCDHIGLQYDVAIDAVRCRCGATVFTRLERANRSAFREALSTMKL
jgi:hypothetical protein